MVITTPRRSSLYTLVFLLIALLALLAITVMHASHADVAIAADPSVPAVSIVHATHLRRNSLRRNLSQRREPDQTERAAGSGLDHTAPKRRRCQGTGDGIKAFIVHGFLLCARYRDVGGQMPPWHSRHRRLWLSRSDIIEHL